MGNHPAVLPIYLDKSRQRDKTTNYRLKGIADEPDGQTTPIVMLWSETNAFS